MNDMDLKYKAVGVISYKAEGFGKYYIGCLAVKKEL